MGVKFTSKSGKTLRLNFFPSVQNDDIGCILHLFH